jgi:hypothetical protein
MEITGDDIADRAAELLLDGKKVYPGAQRLLAQKYIALRARVAALEAELKALKDAPVPAKVPDDEMIGAGVATLQRFRNGGKAEDLVRDIYTAMLAAAQEGE